MICVCVCVFFLCSWGFFCPLGPCSSECQNKRSHTDGGDDDDDDDDDENQSKGAGSQAVKAAEERASRPEESAEVR